MPTRTVSQVETRELLSRVHTTHRAARGAGDQVRFRSACRRNRQADTGDVAAVAWANGLLCNESVRYGDDTETVVRLTDHGLTVLFGSLERAGQVAEQSMFFAAATRKAA